MQAVVQLRGEVNMTAGQRDTLSMLNLGRVNNATLVPEDETYRGMIAKVNDFVAFGEPTADALATVLSTRLEPVAGEDAVDEAYLAEHTAYDDFTALAEALLAEETTLQAQELSPTLRLHPPRGGHDGIKHPAKAGGQLGEHTTDGIDELLEAMR
ncbi:MAG: 50S ribosomal protein L30 [Halolamina sp.]